MGKALYRKYRSRDWGEVVGQEYITKTLQNAVASGKFGHAYLFSGPRGTGKTSVARILARQINGLDYESDEPHIDIIEIDAASNTSVEDIRDLREKISVAPTLAKYKVYVIDEVHMLSKSAANALLKTLEEPPAHAVFILATTDPQKLPPTIISRTQHFVFRPFATEIAAKQLLDIANQEGIELEADAASLIAELGEGSLRDSLSLLDQLSAPGEAINLELVQALAGLPPDTLITELADAIDDNEPKQVIKLLSDSQVSGFRADAIAKRLGRLLREQALVSGDKTKLGLLRQLLSVEDSRYPDQLLEIILLDHALRGVAPNRKPDTVSRAKTGTKVDAAPLAKLKDKPKASPPTKTEPDKEASSDSNQLDAKQLWEGVLEKVRKEHHTLYGMARMATPALAADTLTLSFPYPIHLRRVSDAKNLKIISDIAAEVAGHSILVSCKLDPQAIAEPDDGFSSPAANSEASPKKSSGQPDDINNISNIFGGAELLQSD